MKRAVIFVEYENDKDLQDLLQTAKKLKSKNFCRLWKFGRSRYGTSWGYNPQGLYSGRVKEQNPKLLRVLLFISFISFLPWVDVPQMLQIFRSHNWLFLRNPSILWQVNLFFILFSYFWTRGFNINVQINKRIIF